MEYGKLLNSLPDSLKSKYRNYESITKKYINVEWFKLFNSVGLKENLWPSYTNLKNIYVKSKCSQFINKKNSNNFN